MDESTLKQVTQLWEAGDAWRDVLPAGDAHEVVRSVVGALDTGAIRVAEVRDGRVIVNEAAKHAILMWFRVNEMQAIEVGPFEYVDKLPLKHGYEQAGGFVKTVQKSGDGAFDGSGFGARHGVAPRTAQQDSRLCSLLTLVFTALEAFG